MHELLALIQKYGDWTYLFIFMWTALEGETFVIFAGLLSQKGVLNFWLLLLAAWSGTFCGDQCFFFSGRKFGVHILDFFPKLKPPVSKALGWLERHAEVFILVYRFMYGVRNISGVAIGMSHVKWRKFMAWNAIAALVWAVAFSGFGYLYGDVISHMHHKTAAVEDSVRQLLLGGLGLFVLIIAFRLGIWSFQKRRRALAIKKVHDEQEQDKFDGAGAPSNGDQDPTSLP
jgi:membrane protein DedA with SNARE-associated domain